MKHRITAGITALAMLAAAVPMAGLPEIALIARAEDEAPTSGTCGENLTWEITDGVLTISGTGEMDDYDHYGYVPWKASREKIERIIIGDGATSIGKNAFFGCIALTSVTIPDGVTSIGIEAFHNCGSLTTIKIPNSVTNIGNSAFMDCYDLESITLPNNLTRIEDSMLEKCHKLTSVTIPDSVTEIGSWAFLGCEELTSIVIPDSVTNISPLAFYCCTSLTSISILNPKCMIGSYYNDNGATICNDFDRDNNVGSYKGEICGYDGSTAQTYAEEAGFTFRSLGEAPNKPAEQALGDLDGDNTVNASDAANVLIAAAAAGAGGELGLTAVQIKAADVNTDGTVNASDAAVILIYAAAVGAGDENAKITDFVKK